MIDEIEKQLMLTQDYVEPSRATLYRYGNISSSSIWCVLCCGVVCWVVVCCVVWGVSFWG